MEYTNIKFQIEEHIATITFNRPEVLNALNEASLKEFSRAVDKVNGDENVRVLILTGAGDKSFVAGADIKEFLKFNALKAKMFSEMGHSIVNKLQDLPIPVIGAVNGFALGGGCDLFMHLKTQCSVCRRLIWELFPDLAGPRDCRDLWEKTGPKK